METKRRSPVRQSQEVMGNTKQYTRWGSQYKALECLQTRINCMQAYTIAFICEQLSNIVQHYEKIKTSLGLAPFNRSTTKTYKPITDK